jgi:hypothetical protein
MFSIALPLISFSIITVLTSQFALAQVSGACPQKIYGSNTLRAGLPGAYPFLDAA